MKWSLKISYRKVFYFLLLIPIAFLVYEIRETQIDTRELVLYVLRICSWKDMTMN